MPDTLQIDFEVDGLDRLLTGFQKVEQSALRTGRAVKGAGGPMNQRAALRTDALQRDLDAKGAARQAREDLRTRTAEARANVALLRAQRQKERLERGPKSFGQRFQEFARSTRFGTAGVEPLVGRAADLLGPGAAEIAGPVGLVVLGLSQAGAALKKFADEASQATIAFTRSKYQTGAGPAVTRQLQALNAPMGMDMEGAAAQLAGTNILGGAPLALSALNTLGQKENDLLPEWAGGASDRGSRMMRLLRNIRASKLPDDQERRLLLQAGQDPGLLAVRGLSQDRFDAMMQAAGTAGTATDATSKAAADYAASGEQLSASTDTLTAPMKRRAMEAGAAIKTGAAEFLRGDVPPYRDEQPFVFGGVSFAKASPRAQRAMEHYQMMKDHTDALNRHASVMEKHAQTMNQFRMPGEYGNVTRDGALGAGIGGQALRKAQHDNLTFELSAF